MSLAVSFLHWLSRSGSPWRGVSATQDSRPRPRSTDAVRRARRPLRPLERQPLGDPANDTDEPLLADQPASGRDLVATSRVQGTAVFSCDGKLEGRIGELSIDKASGRIVHVLVRSGGFLGYGERFRPLPWALLAYDWEKHGYVVPFDDAALQAGPELSARDLHRFGVGDDPWRAAVARYYAPYVPIPYP